MSSGRYFFRKAWHRPRTKKIGRQKILPPARKIRTIEIAATLLIQAMLSGLWFSRKWWTMEMKSDYRLNMISSVALKDYAGRTSAEDKYFNRTDGGETNAVKEVAEGSVSVISDPLDHLTAMVSASTLRGGSQSRLDVVNSEDGVSFDPDTAVVSSGENIASKPNSGHGQTPSTDIAVVPPGEIVIANTSAPPQENKVENIGMAACLLIKDDNDRLPEWIAYHYHTLPLRRIVVAVDPTSSESPHELLGRWISRPDLGLEVSVWEDNHFMPDAETLRNRMNRVSVVKLKEKAKLGDGQEVEEEEVDLFRKHIVRQKEFLSWCLYRLKEEGWGWTLIVDSDEFLMFNTLDKNNAERKYPLTGDTKENKYNDPERLRKITEARSALPQTGQMTVLGYIHAHADSPPWTDEPCMPLPRLWFGSLKNAEATTDVDTSPVFFKGLDTLRYRTHAEKGAFLQNFWDKSLVDISRFSDEDFDSIPWYNAHRPFEGCYDVRPFDAHMAERKWLVESKTFNNITPFWRTLLRVNHYLGSWKSYNKRKDPRRNRKLYETLGSVDHGTDDDIRTWISSFVDAVGEELAGTLLQH
eukprot:CAMPEP_0194296100 /NCGR_PEP_ID=MMETSP0169-20130528/55167_1 /TAXON_ID=218684 /ORGANISM="Corethron pennatum, Strain L29A3" /LENGTH=582 /DNA_ID=CAMNT_0039045461 /DNA_START=140 /DNA_END=1888 /DNA_ORIENTATION=+